VTVVVGATVVTTIVVGTAVTTVVAAAVLAESVEAGRVTTVSCPTVVEGVVSAETTPPPTRTVDR
jgi:hypothetical protein